MDQETKIEELFNENLKNRKILLKKGNLVINEDFTEEIMENLFFKIQELDKNNNIKEINIYINSNGGQAFALFPLINLIQSIEKKVNTIVMGKAYSCAALLLLCGTGKRYAYKYSDILLHEVGTSFYHNKNKQIQKDAERLNKINKLVIFIIKENTKMKDTDIKKFMDSNLDICIDSKQALKFGIIDKIIK